MDGTGTTTLKTFLEKLYALHGYLTPKIVLDAARPETSPAHAVVFDVDVGDAAEAHYLANAHRLIQSIRVRTITEMAKAPIVLRGYIAIPGGEEEAYIYRSLADLAAKPDEMKLARNEAVRRLNAAEQSVRVLDAIATGPASKRAKRALAGVRAAQDALTAA